MGIPSGPTAALVVVESLYQPVLFSCKYFLCFAAHFALVATVGLPLKALSHQGVLDNLCKLIKNLKKSMLKVELKKSTGNFFCTYCNSNRRIKYTTFISSLDKKCFISWHRLSGVRGP